MRILHVTPCFPPTWAYGGIPRAVYALARAQRRAGADVRVWTTDAFDATRRSGMPRRYEEDGIEVVVAPLLSNRAAWRHQLYLPLGRPPLDGVDVVHLHAHRHLLNAFAYRAARQRGLPVVQTPNGTAPRIERKVQLKAVWDLLVDGDVPTQADRVVAVSAAEVRSLLALGVKGDRIVRIPNAMHLEEFDALPPRGSFRARHGITGPLVAYLGQISPRKGVDHLVAAFRGEGVVGATLVIAGAARGMALPAEAGVVFPGTLEGPERLALLVDADVLVYPSTDEVFGLVPLEGLLCGAPVIVGGDCGCGELIREARAGLLVDHGDVAAIRSAIHRLLDDRPAADAMVTRGRAYVARHLDPARLAADHLAMYQELLR
jgi:glycosyltransferase involved in cell wall biosynthesis